MLSVSLDSLRLGARGSLEDLGSDLISQDRERVMMPGRILPAHCTILPPWTVDRVCVCACVGQRPSAIKKQINPPARTN